MTDKPKLPEKIEYKSKCCDAEVRSAHGCDDDFKHGGKTCTCEVVTSWFECAKCGEPCDFYMPKPIQKWEYLTRKPIVTSDISLRIILDEMGSRGWELVSATPGNRDYTLIFKRPKI